MRFPILAAKVAEFAQDKVNSWGKSVSDFMSGAWVALAVGVVVLAVLVLWTKFLHRRRKRVTGGEKVYRPSHTLSPDELSADESRRRYKRRVRRREHRGRNPTIAETGGLPPIRTEPRSDPT